jgi:hypothetical protein
LALVPLTESGPTLLNAELGFDGVDGHVGLGVGQAPGAVGARRKAREQIIGEGGVGAVLVLVCECFME